MKGGVPMLRYRVDLSSLDPSKRQEAFNLLNDNSFFAERVTGKDGLEAAFVNWDSSEDFESSAVFPKGCQCTLVSY